VTDTFLWPTVYFVTYYTSLYITTKNIATQQAFTLTIHGASKTFDSVTPVDDTDTLLATYAASRFILRFMQQLQRFTSDMQTAGYNKNQRTH